MPTAPARLVLLGTAQDGGLPQFGADHPNDVAARAGRIPARTAASAALVIGDRAVLIDPSPDLRLQDLALRSEPGLADLRWEGIVLTHAHMGHYLGLAHFGKEAAATRTVPLWATPTAAAFLASNRPWRDLVVGGHVELRPLVAGRPFHPLDGIGMTPIPVPHRRDASDTIGLSIAEDVLYLPDIDRWEAWPEGDGIVAEHRVAILDGCFWSADEVPGRDLSTIPHPLAPDTVARFAGKVELWLTHLNHTNPLCDPASEARRAVAERGVTVPDDLAAVPITP